VSRLTVDRLAGGAALEVRFVDGLAVGADAPPREPHRHDYHELLWVRSGRGEHLLDGQPVPVVPGSVTLIGRGAVHVFQQARELQGAIVRFGEDLLPGGGGPGWLLAGRGGRVVAVPPGEAVHLDATVAALGAEAERPPDARSAELVSHLLSVVLLWIERWHDAARIERPESAAAELHRRFARRLETDFPRHHDAGHYAEALAVPAAALAKALADATGSATKELITDRVMLEARRLLRFTDQTVGEISYAVGFTDPLYFSRAFKRHSGLSPLAFRDRTRGR
jgi:AraC family transcriptional activator of pobA